MDPKTAILTLVSNGWRETDIASSLGCSQSTISRIRNGAKPSYEYGVALVKLAAKKRTRKRK